MNTEMEITLERSSDAPAVHQGTSNSTEEIPKIFCADRETAKKLLIDLFAIIGALRGVQEGKIVDKDVVHRILMNSQLVVSGLGDLMIRDCGVTDEDLGEIERIFQEEMKQAPVATPDPVATHK